MAYIVPEEFYDRELKKMGPALDAVARQSDDNVQNGNATGLPAEAMEGKTLFPIGVIPQRGFDQNGEECFCFHCAYALFPAPDIESRPQYHILYQYKADKTILEGGLTTDRKQGDKTSNKRDGGYRLDPTNSYIPARHKSEYVVNSITVGKGDLSPSTWKMIFNFLDAKKISKASIAYILAAIPPATFHRIRYSQPKKNTLFRLGVILQLDVNQMTEFLASAGFAFNTSDKRETLIKKCFEQTILNPYDINVVLSNANFEPLPFGNFDRLNYQ